MIGVYLLFSFTFIDFSPHHTCCSYFEYHIPLPISPPQNHLCIKPTTLLSFIV